MVSYRVGVAAIALLAALPAAAADLPRPAPYIPPLPVFTWTGFYAGVNLGGGWGGRATFTPVNFPGVGTFSTGERSGFVGGGHFGYNWQYGGLVAGIEADIDGVAADRPTRTFTPAIGLGTFTVSGGGGGYLGSVRGRIGYAVDRFLVFGTGGFAYGGVNRPTVTFQAPGGGAGVVYANGNDHTATGFAVGGGLEYAVTDNWIVRGEYLFYDLGRDNITLRNNTPFAPAGTTIATRLSTSVNVARVGAEYKF
jgi:outer membrane immunogenic protein